MTQNSEIYILNPYYTLKNDRKRVVLCNSPAFKIPQEIAEDSISSYIHPVYAMALSFFTGDNTLGFCLNKIAELFEASIEDSYNFIAPLLDNSKRVGISYDNHRYEFPNRILLNNAQFHFSKREMNYEDFIIDEELDFDTFRLIESPSTINLLINTVCVTDCIYCYVQRDKKIDCQIPIERLCEIIQEAKRNKVATFDIGGTEVFLYKHWEILIKTLLENGFYPYLSTKIPLTKSDLKKIKDLGINDLQLSIDTAINEEALIVNRVKFGDYSDKMFETLRYTEEIGLNIAINVVTTKYNCTESGIELLLDQINRNNNVEKVVINPGETSLYCAEKTFIDFKNSLKEIESLTNYIDKIRENYKFSINVAGCEEITAYKKSFEEKATQFKERAICSGNISQFCILPDGQVTICEELYWHPRFIIGNILENSISEIWKSEKALKLYNISQNEISVHSPCKTCAEFSSCRQYQGVCWSDILTAYGNENWDFPASNCPYAPFPYHNIYHE
jgi:radical SAM protein with 4Fe4S-binding SPASM domain